MFKIYKTNSHSSKYKLNPSNDESISLNFRKKYLLGATCNCFPIGCHICKKKMLTIDYLNEPSLTHWRYKECVDITPKKIHVKYHVILLIDSVLLMQE